MKRSVRLSVGELDKTYEIESYSHYEARVEALKQFLTEFKIPGRPVDYIMGKRRGVITISVKSELDRRLRDDTYKNDGEYFHDQIEVLKSQVRIADKLPDKSKTKATKLLLELEEVLSG